AEHHRNGRNRRRPPLREIAADEHRARLHVAHAAEHVRRARAGGVAAAAFTANYLAVWAAAGAAVYLLYRPHGQAAAAAVVIGAGLYELTPFQRRCRKRCREGLDSGLGYGLQCVGSSAGLMAVLFALGAMSVLWMGVVTALVLVHKLLPPRSSNATEGAR
ncbi:MAG TPA: DUF2182 domain-containing protein, partial [Gaiellales bacterium]|nr:DUF2182 domain-containing protein [Gaiellales bacterium]